MKIGISYNLFDGEELISRSIEVLRECGVEYISVIWQKISYFGQPASEGIEDLLNDFVRKKLVDEIHLFSPKYSGKPAFSLYTTKFARMDENAKRNLGLNFARKTGCTHFLTIDADEFYFPKEFKKAVNFIDQNDIDYSAVSIQSYHLKPTHALYNPNDTMKVPFLVNIAKWPDAWFEYDCGAFDPHCYTDPTRRISMMPNRQKLHIFPKEDIMMHHMRTIRKNLCKKYINSTHFESANPRRVKRLLKKIREKDGVFEGTINTVDNHFNIQVKTDTAIGYEAPNKNWQTPLFWLINFLRSKIVKPLKINVYR
jgi:hypothetical protein